ncbi:hypothetical protein DLE60_19505 [Micromonospora globispora]|uniref:PD-(D/E)XK nuclease family protein n=2 Tax=Micromonospora globispora TaxID=1450148 RepID=A0A317K5W0_9ACTN|nr:hypothetical protein DLJ46_12990 [Micromonospora globispora]PWU58857.1 hypothetical protein DLE60_19505 [Micromonospora globispora]
MSALSAEAAEIKAGGGWRRGPRTVLQAVGLEQSELKLVKLLGWLLSPDGHHGLGSSVVAALLNRLDIPYVASDEVEVSLEESCFDPTDSTVTRADLVLRSGKTCVLIEAKVWADEQPEQCDRLGRLWRHEHPALVFLTPWGDLPKTAVCSDDSWTAMSWGDIAEIIIEATSVSNQGQNHSQAPGVWDYVRTLQLFQGEQRSLETMSADGATCFYARHWKKIDEWVALREEVLTSINVALKDAFDRNRTLVAPGAEHGMDDSASTSYPTFELYRPAWRRFPISIALQWQPQQRTGNPWPYIGIRAYQGWARDERLMHLREALKPNLGRLNWLEYKRGDAFLCWKHIEPTDGDLYRLGELCRTELQQGWSELADPIDQFFADAPSQSGG